MTRILVVPTDKLFEVIPYFNGFRACSSKELDNIVGLISRYGAWKRRDFSQESEIEQNPNYKQLIPYGVVVTREKEKDKFLFYERGTGKGDARIMGRYSMGVGGHIEARDGIDFGVEQSLEEKLEEAVKREIREEIKCGKVESYRFFGLINDDREPLGKENFIYKKGKVEGANLPIGRVHLGLVYVVRTSQDVSLIEKHQKNFKLASLGGLLERKTEMETWSQHLLDYLEKMGPFFVD